MWDSFHCKRVAELESRHPVFSRLDAIETILCKSCVGNYSFRLQFPQHKRDHMTDHQGKLLFIFAPPATLILLSVITLAVGGFPEFMAPWPFLIAIFAVGLPHGASDFVMSRRLDGTSVSETFFRFGWYVAVMTCVLASLAIAPLFVIGAFGLLSAWHFGRADAEDLDDISPVLSDRSIPKAVWALSRGFLVVRLPFVCSFEISLSILNMLLAWCGSAA